MKGFGSQNPRMWQRVWGGMDLSWVAIGTASAIYRGVWPLVGGLPDALELARAWGHGLLSIVSIADAALGLSILVSGCLLVLGKGAAYPLVIAQTPLRILLVTPSLWLLPYAGQVVPVPLMIVLLVISELGKLWTLRRPRPS